MRTVLEEFWTKVLMKYGRSGPILSDNDLRTLDADGLHDRIMGEWSLRYSIPKEISIATVRVSNYEESDDLSRSLGRLLPILRIRDVRRACIMTVGSIIIGLHDQLILGEYTENEDIIKHQILNLIDILIPCADFDVSSSCRLAAIQSLAEMSAKDESFVTVDLFKRKMANDSRGSVRAVALKVCEDRLDKKLAEDIVETAGFLARYDTTDAKTCALRILTKSSELGFVDISLSLAYDAALTACGERQELCAEKLLWQCACYDVRKVAECISGETELSWKLGKVWPMAWFASLRALLAGNMEVINLLQKISPPGAGALLDSVEQILHNISDSGVRAGAFKLLAKTDCDEVVTNDLEGRYDKLWVLMRGEAPLDQQMEIVDHASAREWSQEWQAHIQKLLRCWLQEAETAEELRVLSGAIRGFYPQQGLDDIEWDIVSCARSLRGLLVEWSLNFSDPSACQILRGLAAEYFTKLASGLSVSSEIVTVLRGLTQYYYSVPKLGGETFPHLNGRELGHVKDKDAVELIALLDSLKAWKVRPPIASVPLDLEP